MYYAIVHYPDIDCTRINQIREKYDPTFGVIDPHITVLFPVPESVGEKKVIQHIESISKKWSPFPIHICGYTKSWDHWLFLTLEDGNEKVTHLYCDLYSGPLAQYRRTDIEFIPHIGMGLFVKNRNEFDFSNPQAFDFDEQTYNQAIKKAESLNLDFKCIVDKIHLIKLTDDFSQIVESREFSFPKK